MSSTRMLTLAAALMAISMAGCSDQVSRSFIVQPNGRYTLSGSVVIRAATADSANNPLGTRVVGNASGVRVRLVGPNGLLDSTLTRSGRFEFGVNDSGFYRVFCWVIPFDTVSKSDVVVGSASAEFPDTLRLGPFGVVSTYPTPFGPSGVGVEFPETNVDLLVELSMRNLAGTTVWSYSSIQRAGLGGYHVHWTGLDNDDNEVPDGSYWAVAHRDGGYHYNLVFKE